MNNLNPTTFDLADIFTGNNYPTDITYVYFNEDIGYRVHKLKASLLLASGAEEREEIQKQIEALTEEGKNFRYEIHLKGVSRDLRRNVIEKAEADFPVERDFMGRVVENHERTDQIIVGLWTLFLEKIIAPNGAQISPVTEEDVRKIRAGAPDRALEVIDQAIGELSSGTADGFETMAQEHDFLSKP